jgi:hypothetical protein
MLRLTLHRHNEIEFTDQAGRPVAMIRLCRDSKHPRAAIAIQAPPNIRIERKPRGDDNPIAQEIKP